jgi:hypothetical protein
MGVYRWLYKNVFDEVKSFKFYQLLGTYLVGHQIQRDFIHHMNVSQVITH